MIFTLYCGNARAHSDRGELKIVVQGIQLTLESSRLMKKIAKKLRGILIPNKENATRWPEGHRDVYAKLFSKAAIQERRFYNVGAGMNFRHPAWTNVGLISEVYGSEHIDLEWDLQLLQEMPVSDASAEIVYTRYTLEHVNDAAVSNFLKEAYRVLKPGGLLRVIVPDIEVYFAAYQEKDPTLFYKPKRDKQSFPNKKFKSNPNEASFEQQFVWVFASGATEIHNFEGSPRVSDADFLKLLNERSFEDTLNYCTSLCTPEFQKAFPQFHINWFHAKKLEEMMREAGFMQTFRSAVGQSRSAAMHDLNYFDDRRSEIGLFMEAIK